MSHSVADCETRCSRGRWCEFLGLIRHIQPRVTGPQQAKQLWSESATQLLARQWWLAVLKKETLHQITIETSCGSHQETVLVESQAV